MRETPETDELKCLSLIEVMAIPQERREIALGTLRAIKERDEARESLKHITEYGTEEINAAVELRQKLAQALVELDNMQYQRDLAMKVISRLENERDEAREKLENEIKWHHQTHKELVEAQCKLLDIEYDQLKS